MGMRNCHHMVNYRYRVLLGVASTAGLLLSIVGCEGDAPQSPSSPTSKPAARAPTPQDSANVTDMIQQGKGNIPPGHPPIQPGGMDAGAGMPGMANAAAPTLAYTAPTTWKREPPSSGMRLDQYRLPRVSGDNDDGDLALFGGISGTVEDNIARWRTQMVTADGKPAPDPAVVRQQIEANGLKITAVDIAGRYTGGMGPGGDTPKDNYRMLGAVIQTPDGLLFVKATGPAATIGDHRAEFMDFLRSMHLADKTSTVGAPAGAPTSAPASAPKAQ
jgi:hypothetical protein